jgi:protoporphyrinogen oxidase
MDQVHTLIVGAGVSGLSAAAFSPNSDYLILEGSGEIGGYCKTIKRNGFVWDHSGHFFHFRHADIEAWLRARMPARVRTVERRSSISYGGRQIDFPFQKNIHQLEKHEFIDCLHDLYFACEHAPAAESSFQDMLYGRLGRAICDKFLIPYNTKLYACDLGTLDVDAMGRFFPHADVADIIRNMRNMKAANDASYNATFVYPEGGAIEYIQALASAVRPGTICLDEPLVRIDLPRKVAHTSRRSIQFERLISSAPLNHLVAMSGLAHDPAVFTWNKVLVFNLGFDRKGPEGVHWIYYPDPERVFYRVGFYDNIFETSRMSLYVEIGFGRNANIDVDATRARVLEDLRKEGVVTDHQLVGEHHVVMDPAYVHITKASLVEVKRLRAELAACGVYPVGRYGGWTYCSIEDNIVEARALVGSPPL